MFSRRVPMVSLDRQHVLTAPRGGRSHVPPDSGIGVVDMHARVQRQAEHSTTSDANVHAAARLGTSGPGGRLPHASTIQRAFGRHDVSKVVAHLDGRAAQGAETMGALAFTRGEHVAFRGAPDVRLAAHEAAHVVQQRAGVRLSGGVGRAGDRHERLADEVADRVAAGGSAEPMLDRMVGSSRSKSNPATAPAVQCYSVLGVNKLMANMPARRPWFGYPYAVVTGGNLIAQTPRVNVGGNHEFLDANGSNTAWTQQAGNGFGLRVSGNNDMAIEDSDLTNRQPKVFYATQAVVDASNRALQATQSRFRLVRDGNTTVTILTGWWSQTVLGQVTPTLDNGNADNAPQNCNAMGAAVMGWDSQEIVRAAERRAVGAAKRIAPTAGAEYQRWEDNRNDARDVSEVFNPLAQEYVQNRDSWAAWWQGANRYAAPSVGQSYVIYTLGDGGPNARGQVRDYESNQVRNLNWSFHFGGVVAKSGDDRVTLENYARGDNRQDNADPRWYFQMYGTAQGQSFHEFYKAKNDYANPITMAVSR
jgi:hypothetical protein